VEHLLLLLKKMLSAREIDQLIQSDRRRIKNELKILLLGTGDSGKSTVAKQMKIIFHNGFTKEELSLYISVIHSNLIMCIRMLVFAAQRIGFALASEENEAYARELIEFEPEREADLVLTESLVHSILSLWRDRTLQSIFYERKEHLEDLPSCADYLFQNLERIAADGYQPTQEDVLRCRQRTSGIVETRFSSGKTDFKMVDVGGQRSERRKWIHCFQDVTALIFVVAIDEYDMKLSEDKKVNRMLEAYNLWTEIVHNSWFKESTIILFFNKSDLFREKIKHVDLNVTFKDYRGGRNYDHALAFLTKMFVDSAERDVFVHATCATDTEAVRIVFDSVRDTIIGESFAQGGMRL